MKIKGIPFALKSPVAVRLVKKFLGDIAKNLYRKDAKKQQRRLDFLFYFALFASSQWECLIRLILRLSHPRVCGGPFLPCCKYGFPHSRKWRTGFFHFLFRVIPSQMLLLCLPALTHPALISRLIPCNSVFVRGKCISFGLFASLFRVNPWQMPFLCWPWPFNRLGSFCFIYNYD